MPLARAGWAGGWLLAALLVAACAGPSEDPCPQTGEFGNVGCGRISGPVLTGAGQPVEGASVTLRAPEGATSDYTNPSAETDAAGGFRLEIYRFSPPAPPPLDTVPLYLRAALVLGEDVIADSVLVGIIFAPVEQVAPIVERDVELNSEGSGA